MPYPTVLVHIDNSARAAGRVRVAAALARAGRGHLVGVALTGVSRFLYRGEPATDNPYLALHLTYVRERAVQAVAAFRREAEAAGVASFEGRVVDDETGAGLSLHARVADLVVLGQAAPGAHGKSPEPDYCPYVLLHAGRPVLLLPAGFDPEPDAAAVGRHVLIAWDASQAAGRALLGALPLLKQAESVRIAVLDDGPGGHAQLDAAAADPLPFLARHGVRATLEAHALAGRHSLLHRDAVGNALLSLAAVNRADLLVMGAYGHSRVRETILGGVTGTVLAAMTLPVLMEH